MNKTDSHRLADIVFGGSIGAIVQTAIITKDWNAALAVGIGCFVGYTLLAVLDAVLIRR